jgi:hypothetical protein
VQPWPVTSAHIEPGEVFAQPRHQDLATQDDDRREQRGAADGAVRHQHQQAGRYQELVGDRVEHAAEGAELAPLARKVAVQEVGHAGSDENRQRDPAQPFTGARNFLEMETQHHRRHGGDARIGQEIRQRKRARRHRPVRNWHAADAIHESQCNPVCLGSKGPTAHYSPAILPSGTSDLRHLKSI